MSVSQLLECENLPDVIGYLDCGALRYPLTHLPGRAGEATVQREVVLAACGRKENRELAERGACGDNPVKDIGKAASTIKTNEKNKTPSAWF